MKTNAINHNLFSLPWAMRQEAFMDVLARAQGKNFVDEMFDFSEDDAKIEVEIDDGVAIVPVSGVIGYRLPVFMRKIFGMTSVDALQDVMEELVGSDDVRAIVMDIDSPGGVVSGVPEFSEMVAGINKPVIAYTSRLMASAAYWMGASAQAIYASKSAIVGSVGVFLPIVLVRRYYESMGIDVEVIKAGKFKATGYPGTSISDDQRKDLQDGVDYVYRLFSGFVAGRREVDMEHMQGQDFYAEVAMGVNMVDQIATLDQAIEDARSLADRTI